MPEFHQARPFDAWVLRHRVLCFACAGVLMALAALVLFLKEFAVVPAGVELVAYLLVGLAAAVFLMPRYAQHRMAVYRQLQDEESI
jgi:hypothetical protein